MVYKKSILSQIIVCYYILVISMQDELTHLGSRISLCRAQSQTKRHQFFFPMNYKSEMIHLPTLLIHAEDDSIVNPKNSIIYFNALQKNNIPSKLHLLKNGWPWFWNNLYTKANTIMVRASKKLVDSAWCNC